MVPYVRKKGRSFEPQLKGPSNCLSKTQLSAKSQNGGRNYNGPKVAKFLVR